MAYNLPRRVPSLTEEELWQWLDGHKLAVLATASRDGAPEAALMGIALSPQLDIVFDTVRTSRKYPNLIANPRVAFVIGTINEVTVQYEGEAEELAGERLEYFQKVYFAKWPDGPERMSWPNITYFVVHPKWIRYSDFATREIVEFRF